MALRDSYSKQVIQQAERELFEEEYLEDIARCKAVLRSRALRFARFKRFVSLQRASWNELVHPSA